MNIVTNKDVPGTNLVGIPIKYIIAGTIKNAPPTPIIAAMKPTINPRMIGNRRRIVFGELAGKTGAEYLMSLLGMKDDKDNAKNIAAGLKNLRMGDLLEIPLEDKMERKIINDEVRRERND